MTSEMIEPDDKDWTWVLREPCAECGFVVVDADPVAAGGSIGTHVERWQRVLTRPDVAARPRPDRWSDLEYACHVRDVFTVFAGRVDQMLAEAPARFANWDQDAAALDGDYAHTDPAPSRPRWPSRANASPRRSAGSAAATGIVRGCAPTGRSSRR